MATFVLLPGAASDSWYWHLVTPALRASGHDVVAVDLPCDDDAADLNEYTDVTVRAIAGRRELVIVAQSMGAFTAALVAERVPVDLLILVAAMVPTPGESPGDWWVNTGQPAAMRELALREGRDPDKDFDPFEVFLHDVPPDLVAESAKRVRRQSATPFERPWSLDAWPDVSTRFILCRNDRLFPADFQRRIVKERLNIRPDEIDSGHLPALSHPIELAGRLLDCLDEDVGRRQIG